MFNRKVCRITLLQDCMLVIPPFPFHPDPDNFDTKTELEDAFIVRPLLFFKCFARPLRENGSRSEISDNDIPLSLMFYSKFEQCNLTPNHPLQKEGMTMVYDPKPTEILFVDYIDRALGRVPLMPCYISGNATPTIPQSFRHKKSSQFPHGRADGSNSQGSLLFEVNHFMWNFPRPKARDISVTDAYALSESRPVDTALIVLNLFLVYQ